MNYLKKTARLWLASMLLMTALFSPRVVFASELQTHVMSVRLENATLKELFDIIEEKFDYSFLIRNNDIDLNERVTLDIADKSVEEILTNALKKQNAAFTVNDRRIVVYKSAKQMASLSALSEAYVAQQTMKVTGTVVDAVTGEPIVGANVIVKGAAIGSSTDFDGNFELEIPSDAILVVSYIGYINIEVKPTASPMTIRLREDAQALDEIVVVGYGVQKRESLTGAMQTLNNEKLTNITTPSVQNMIAGKAPGVLVAPGDGKPGSAGRILIRGKASINGTNDPLYVIDGVIVGNSPDYASLNPMDIESMTILKDAASTAIYGSQGANGVIMITTKKAKTSDKVSISGSIKAGISRLSNGNVEMMDGAELYDYYKSFSNQERISFTRWNEHLRDANFNWWDFATQTGVTQDYNLSISGGTEKMKSYLSVGYYDETGTVKGYEYKRYNFRLRSEYKPFDFLTIKPLISGNRRDIDDKQHSVGAMYRNLPWDSPYQEDGTLTPHYSPTWVNNWTNYLYDLQWNRSGSKTYSFMGNLDFDVKITDWLTFSSVNSFNYDEWQNQSYQDPRSNSAIGVNGRLSETVDTRQRRYTNQLLRFNKTFGGKHDVTGTVAYEFRDYRFKSVQAVGTGFISGFSVLDVAARPEKTAGYISEDAMQSFFFKGTYAYDNKYLLEASFRRDGASNFGDNAKYGNFFSFSGGWNLHREDFMEYEWLDQLKLRTSYGSMGNRPSALYPQYDLYKVNQSYNEVPGALIDQIGNRDLTWEKTFTFGVGVDIGIFDRFRASFDYYNKYTSNVLFRVPISGFNGVTSIWQNIGEIENNGFEMTLGADIIKNRDIYWGIDFNLGINKNRIKKLYSGIDQIIESSFGGPASSISRILLPGHDMDTFYGKEWAGVNPDNGAPQWYETKDGNRQKTSNYAAADQVTLGTLTPDFFGGFSTNFAWKSFDLNAVFSYSVGGQIYNYSRQEFDSDGTYTDRNQYKLQKGWSRWEKPGDNATHPLPAYNNNSKANNASSRYIEDADYLKLRTLSVGYNFSLPQWHVSNLRLFFTAENVFTITPYSGIDPEIPIKDDGKIVNVVGASVYPLTRKFMFGLNFTL
ncbi:MAG: TonB-dependent receptor [Tannerellaceae bacterium]|jgi:TonB-linked SusC/RagA family outer membrane protein|nr:TonB-dependent receptor [Tannerellaceae bacterium]